MVTALVDEVRADQTYFFSWDGQDIYLAGDIAATLWEQAPMGQARAQDALAIQLSPVQAQKPHEDAAPVLFIYPHEGGRDQRQPSAVRWSESDGYQAMRLRMVLRRSPKGFTIEARIPGTVMWGIRGKPGASWKIAVRYQNIAEGTGSV